jgi:dTDP-4-dehydrorhamnose 3,5-epimerase
VTARQLDLPEVLLIEPRVYKDERGDFFESWNATSFAALIGATTDFVQDNHSTSREGVIRGLHYQLPPYEQGKLVRVARGAAFDVVVDIRQSSPNFGQWVGAVLSDHNRHQIWVPPGFAHGFLALSDGVDILYKTTSYYAPESDRSIRWDDPVIGIDWPLEGEPNVSDKDRDAPLLADAEVFD